MRLHFLDGMRGWAALMVVIWHYFISIFPASDATKQALHYLPFLNGPLAVSIFFVISGFALSIAMVEKPSYWRLARMSASRYFRLAIPVVASCLIVYLAMVAGLIFRPFPETIASQLQFEPSFFGLLKFSFFDVFFRYLNSTVYNTPLWTMQFELFGSAIVFLLLLTLQWWRWRLVAYAILLAYYLAHSSFYALFVAGVILANLLRVIEHTRLSRLHYALIAIAIGYGACVPYLTHNTKTTLGLVGIIGLFSALVILPGARRFFSTPLSRFLGAISFPIYLVHVPVVYIFSVRFYAYLLEQSMSVAASALCTGVVSLAIAFAGAWLFLPVEKFSITASQAIGNRCVAIGQKLLARLSGLRRVAMKGGV